MTRPSTYKHWQVQQTSSDWRKATKLVEDSNFPKAHEGTVVVRNHYLGINATDVNITDGAYSKDPPPFGTGLDGMGVVDEVGPGVKNLKEGDVVLFKLLGAFSEYVEVPEAVATKIPEFDTRAMSFMTCGASASMALEHAGEMKSGENVLVTAAAGATGQIVVQLAKLAGNHVIGTCGSKEKGELLKSLGCDRVIYYKEEDVGEVLKKEYPNGVNLVFEGVGGDLFKAAVQNIAIRGRIIVFGMVSGYKNGNKDHTMLINEVAPILLFRSAHLRGFISFHYMEYYQEHMEKLINLLKEDKLKIIMDDSNFEGMEKVPDAVERLHSGKSAGKVIVKIA